VIQDACRIDVWLWRARFCKSRSIAADLVERGAVRLTRHGTQIRLDKPSRSVHPGDLLTFVRNGEAVTLRVEALGERRGPAQEARALYTLVMT
jgi:ribosome-associated heat shock protein Hsp15